jgi:hypothetical protein
MKKLLLSSSLMALLVSCAGNNRKMHEKLRAEALKGDYKSALKIVKDDNFYPEKSNKLLKLMEEALALHLNGDYFQAKNVLDQAKDLSDQLFTASISKKAAAALVNDNADNYYGDNYERSMIRFYQALNHFSLYNLGVYEAHEVVEKDEKGKIIATKQIQEKKLSDKEIAFHLSATRSTLLEWNSLLESYKADQGGEAVYKDDLLAKIFGAYIHEQIGSNTDRSIALNLYKEAKVLLFRNYNTLPSYNNKYKDFIKNFDQFATMDEGQVRKNYVESTVASKDLDSFLDEQIKRMSEGKGARGVMVLFENQLISPKEAKKFDFNIPVDSVPANIPKGNFVAFSAKVLGAAANAAPKIYFEMPTVNSKPVTSQQVLIVKDEAGKVVLKKSLAIVNPLSDMASNSISGRAISSYAKVGTRVAAKHIVALASAYALYESQKSKNETMAMMLAGTTYAGLNKGIEKSEEADLRSWTLLPDHYSLAMLNLNPGKYHLEYLSNNVTKDLGEIVVTDRTSLIKRRLMN